LIFVNRRHRCELAEGVTFGTFPFPDGLAPEVPASAYATDPRAARIAEAARRLDELRRNWLNPPDLTRTALEVVADFPDRIAPIHEHAAAILRKRTLTALYSERPTWLDNAHVALDRAVLHAYGWPENITDEDVLARLLELSASLSASRCTRRCRRAIRGVGAA
jgi:type II restriction/modification system DNA methylase subunit YeeA